MASSHAILYPKLRAFNLWSTHQGAGKTTAAIATTLSVAFGVMKNIGYSKPVSVGEKNERQHLIRFIMRWREGKAIPKWFTTKAIYHETADTSEIFRSGRILKGTGEKLESGGYVNPFSDRDLLKGVKDYAHLLSDFVPSERGKPPAGSWLFFETLAGVDTYLPSKTPQADLYSQLRLPGLLVADSRPGGLQNTIKAFEYLRCRGHDIQGAFIFKGPEDNHEEIAAYFDENDVYCAVLRQVPAKQDTERKDLRVMMDYYKGMGRSNTLKGLVKYLDKRHSERVRAKEKGVPDPKEVELDALVLATQAERALADKAKEREAEKQVARDARTQNGRPRPSGPSQNAWQATPSEESQADVGRFVAPPRRHGPAAGAGGGGSPRNHRDPSRPESRSQGSRSAGGYGDRSAPPGRYEPATRSGGGDGHRVAPSSRYAPATRSGGGGYEDRNEQSRQARRPDARTGVVSSQRAAPPRRFEPAERSGGGRSWDRWDSSRPDSRGRASRTEVVPRQRAAPPRRHEPTDRSGGGSSGDYRERRTHTGPPSGADRSRFAGKPQHSGPAQHRPAKHVSRGSRKTPHTNRGRFG